MVRKSLSAYVLAMTLMLGGAAFARDDNDRRDSRYGYGDLGAEQGYRDGVEHGRYDRSRRAGYNHKSDQWKRGDRGYQKQMGSKGQYKQRYRDAYVQGYQDGFHGRGGWGGIFGQGRYPTGDDRNRNGIPDDRERRYPSDGEIWRDGRNGGVFGNSEVARVASDHGFQDGAYYAQRDMSRGKSANPTDAKGYKDADHGYNSRYNRDEFKRYYRDAFIRGYNQEYGYRYGRR